MNYLIELFLSVMANVISYYICKRLDSKDRNRD